MDVEVPVLEILVSELVTNALLHGDGPIGLRLASDGQSVRLEVTDDGGTATTPHLVEHEQVGGWGLHLVDRLADSWGTDHADHATRVWTETRPRTAPGHHADDGPR
jgi:anti-sigma regulatory factor (Ser/Thr protein kinase)